MFKKILIANRGEIAVRIIRACRELKIKTVAVHSTADANSLHVQWADEAVCIGPPASKDSYLYAPNIISAAHITGADAIHPGIGFLSERASFAEACEACGLKFIGPPASVMERMGDKAMARETMRAAGVPVIPGTPGALTNEQEAQRFAQRTGYPLLIKAAMGGGGRGIRLVQNDEELSRQLDLARSEAISAFGSPEVYIEKFVEEPRHIEVQILADEYGHVVHLGERECSIQLRHQKLVEECPASLLSASQRRNIGEAAVKAARAIGYSNAGTVEFLLDARGDFYFLEMNKRLQVEHCITEQVTGIDLVKMQITIAAGEKLPFNQKEVRWEGHAIECRLNAGDPEQSFAASAGRIEKVILPGGYGVRVDTHIFDGYEVPPYYDSLLAKIIAWDKTRAGAVARMQRCLQETEVAGIRTNLAFQRKINTNAFYRRNEISTDFIQRRILNGNSNASTS